MNQELSTNRIKTQLKKVDLNIVQTKMKGVCQKLRKIEDKEPFPILECTVLFIVYV